MPFSRDRLSIIHDNIYVYEAEDFETLPDLLTANYFSALPVNTIVSIVSEKITNKFTVTIDETGTASVAGFKKIHLKNNKIIAVGDSRIGYAYYPTSLGSYTALDQRGALAWFLALTNAPFSHVHFAVDSSNPPEGDAVGIAGEGTRQIYLRFKRDVLDKDPGLVFIVAGTNDLGLTSRSAEHIADNLTRMVEDANAIGAHVWLCTIDPRTDLDATKEARRIVLNNLLRAYAATNSNMTLIDVDALLSVNGAASSLYLTDTVHWNSNGAYRIARYGLLPAYQRINPTAYTPYYVPDYLTSTTDLGNIFPNAAMTGTGGIINSTASGIMPDLLRAATSSTTGITINTSVVQRADLNGVTRNFIRFAISCDGSGSDAASVRIHPRDTAQTADTDAIITGYAADQWYESSVEVHIENATAGLIRSVFNRLEDFNGVTTSGGNQVGDFRFFNDRFTDDDPAGVKDIFPNDTMKLLLKTQPCRAVGDRFLSTICRVALDGTVTGSVDVYIGNPIIKRLPYMPAIHHKQRLYLERISDGAPFVAMINSTGDIVGAESNQYTTPT